MRARILARWNSTGAEAAKDETKGEQAQAEQKEEQDPVQKDLKAKEREIIDLKVSGLDVFAIRCVSGVDCQLLDAP